MRLLFITEKFPYPLDTGGNVRTYHILRGLAAAHEVTLVATDAGDVQPVHVNVVRALCRDVILARTRAWTTMQDAMVLLGSFFHNDAVVIRRRFRTGLAVTLQTLADSGFDAVFFNHLDAAIYLPYLPSSVVKILDEHNVVTNQVRSMAAAEEGFMRRWVLERDVSRVARFEAAIASHVDLCLACSDQDAASLRQLGARAPVAVIPNGVDTSWFCPAGRQFAADATPGAVFVGTLDYDPCERGLWHFATAILPLIRKELPDFRLVAVGRNPSRRLQGVAAADPRVVLTGRVEDVRPWMAEAQVCVVPLLSGSGTRLKILEAMAAGVPVVSTTIGAEGIDVADGMHLWIADEPDRFAARVVEILQDPAAAWRVSEAARKLVVERYSWDAVHARLHARLSDLPAMAGKTD